MWGSCIPYSMPVYPGAFDPSPMVSIKEYPSEGHRSGRQLLSVVGVILPGKLFRGQKPGFKVQKARSEPFISSTSKDLTRPDPRAKWEVPGKRIEAQSVFHQD